MLGTRSLKSHEEFEKVSGDERIVVIEWGVSSCIIMSLAA